jgi:rod shape-determining protein MreC
METLLNRYRNITVLLLVIFAQLVLLGYQVKSNQDVPMIRVWAVTAVTPLARVLESFRSGIASVFENYFTMRDVRAEKERLQHEVDRLKIENLFLRDELSTADRMQALSQFQGSTPSRTLAARVIGTGAGSDSKLLFLDRGSLAGVKKGMGVVTPDGIVGRVVAAYPTASQVLQVTGPDFAAGVVSQNAARNRRPARAHRLRTERGEGGDRRVVLHVGRGPHLPARLSRGPGHGRPQWPRHKRDLPGTRGAAAPGTGSLDPHRRRAPADRPG